MFGWTVHDAFREQLAVLLRAVQIGGVLQIKSPAVSCFSREHLWRERRESTENVDVVRDGKHVMHHPWLLTSEFIWRGVQDLEEALEGDIFFPFGPMAGQA